VEALIRHLVERHVAITSTLAVFESELGAPPERDAAPGPGRADLAGLAIRA
jgi:hypothetical protein